MKIVLTGANGGIGRRLAAALAREHDVTGIVRTLPGDRANRGLTYVTFADKLALADALGSADCVIHCALDSKAKGRDFLAINKAMDAEILSGALAGQCRLYLYVSSQVVYSGIDPATEHGYSEAQQLVLSPALDDYTRLKIEGERLVRDACEKKGVDWLIVRPTVVMGPGLAWSDGVVKAASVLSFGIKSRLMNLIHADDLSDYVAKLLAKGARNAIYNLGTANYESTVYFDEVGRITGHRTIFLPDWAMRLIGRIFPSTLWFFARRVGIDARKVMAETAFDPTRHIAALFEHQPTEIRATTLAELQTVQRQPHAFRTHGQGYSHWFNPRHGDDRLVMAGYRGIVSLEDGIVTVKAGTRLGELNLYLDQHNLTLATLPEFSGVSAAACFFVDVHGSSPEHFSLYELIEEIKYLDEGGTVVVSRDKAEWPALRQRTSRFILLELSLRTIAAGWLSNRMEFHPEARLDAYFAGAWRDNLSTTLHWYPRYRQLLVYNINRADGPQPGAAPSVAPFRGLPYHMQRWLLAVALRGRTLQIDRYHAILAPWKRVPLERVANRYMSRPNNPWRDMELCVGFSDGVALIGAMRSMIANGEIEATRRMGVGIRFSHKQETGEDFIWIEFVTNDRALVDLFIATARRLAKGGISFHKGKYVPPN